MNARYDYLITFLVEKATPSEILVFQLPESEQPYAIELLDKQDEETLTPEETVELHQMQELNRLITKLRIKALAS